MVLRHEARLRAFLGRLAGAASGDELAQEAFLRAWLRAGDYRGQGSYEAWIMGIGWRLFLDDARRARRRQLLWDGGQDGENAPVTPVALDVALDMNRLLQQISPEQCAAILLCDGHGWSHSEAAAIMGVPLGTVKSLALRGKQRLRALLAEGSP